MTGLELVHNISKEIERVIKCSIPTDDRVSLIKDVLKRHVVEVSQRCSFSKNSIPKEDKEASDFRRYAKSSALHKLSIEGLSEIVSTDKFNEEDEEVIIYKVFAIRP